MRYRLEVLLVGKWSPYCGCLLCVIVINIIIVVCYYPLHKLNLIDFYATMNIRPNALNTGRGGLKTFAATKNVKTEVKTFSPAAKGVKTEVPSLMAGSQTGSVQHDKGSRFTSVGDNNSRLEESQAKDVEAEKTEPAAADDNGSAAQMQPVPKEKKFTGRCRLFIGNLPNDMTEHEFQKFFEPYGELNEVFLNASRGFGFVRLVSMFLK